MKVDVRILLFVTCIYSDISKSLANLTTEGQLEKYIVGGEFAQITDFPNLAFLIVSCRTSNSYLKWACGGSVLNQRIILTAAHCLDNCLPAPATKMLISVGSKTKGGGAKYAMSQYKVHDEYDPSEITDDIALILTQTEIRFGETVKRVLILKKPPYFLPSVVAGWGLVDESLEIDNDHLKKASQKVWSRYECNRALENMPQGTICAVNGHPKNSVRYGYAAEGDSGSALMVHGYVQIGLVSYKKPDKTSNVVVYTEIAHFYTWILSNAKSLICKY